MDFKNCYKSWEFWALVVGCLVIGGVITYLFLPQIVTEIVTIEKEVPVEVEKIVYVDKPVIKEVIKEVKVTSLTCAKGSVPIAENTKAYNEPTACAKAHDRSLC